MKNTVYTYFAIATFLLIPKFGYAEDIATYLVEKANNAQKELLTPIRDSMSNLSDVSKNLVNGDFSNINLNSLKNMATGAVNTANKVLKIDDKIPASFADKINGVGVSSALRGAVKDEFTVGKRSGNDVKKNTELAEKANDLMIENVSLMYARGLVRRYQLENEEKTEIDDLNNVSGVQTAYLATIKRANDRWISMLQSESSLMTQTSMQQIMTIRPDETEQTDNATEGKKQN